MDIKIAVLGAGVNGLSCALKIKEKYKDSEVVIISEKFSPNTTGDGSGGLWYPYLCGSTPMHLILKWGIDTYKHYHELWRGGSHNICLIPIFSLYREQQQSVSPEWASHVFGYHDIDKRHLEYLSQMNSTHYCSGHTFNTFTVLTSKVLDSMMQRFKAAGGKVVQAKVSSLQDPLLDEYQVVVNCLGVASRHVVPDERVFPTRGQVTKVFASWLTRTVIDDDAGHYIIPNAETCVLGGTHQDHDYNTDVDDVDTEFIMNGCQKIIPGLKHAIIFNHWAGLRPARNEVRLEPEEINGKLYIHNYGHGGSGFTLFWGCSNEVLRILDENFSKTVSCQRSKL